MSTAVLLSLLGAGAATAAVPGKQPSFLFILGDDIGWSDFSYNNGTAASPFIKVCEVVMLPYTNASNTVGCGRVGESVLCV